MADSGDVEATGAALDQAVGRFLASAHAVETTIGAAGSPAGDDEPSAEPDRPATNAVGESPESSRDGMAGVLNDLAGNATTLRDHAVESTGHVSEQASTADDDLNREGRELALGAADWVQSTASDLHPTAGEAFSGLRDAGTDVAHPIGAGAAPIRDDFTASTNDPGEPARVASGEAAGVAEQSPASVSSTVPDDDGSFAGAGDTRAGVTGRLGEVAHAGTGSALDIASGIDGANHSPLSGGPSAPEADHVAASSGDAATAESMDAKGAASRAYTRLVVSAVALGTASGFNRWAVRRLTGADIALLGPATIRPAILGTGLATLIASVYLVSD